MIMIRVIKQYGISILLLIVAIFCLFNIGQNIQDAFTVITNSLAIFLAIFYFVNFEKDIIIKIKKFVLNIKWPFHGKTKKILTNILNFIVKKRWDIISYLFIFLLLIITLGQFSYLERFINLSWINKYQIILTVLAILSGGLTFWHNREKIQKIIEIISNIQIKQWQYIISLILIFLLFVATQIYKIYNSGIGTDEGNFIYTLKLLNDGQKLFYDFWSRESGSLFFLYPYFKLVKISIINLRFFIFFSHFITLAVFYYFINKLNTNKLNKLVISLLSVVILSFNGPLEIYLGSFYQFAFLLNSLIIFILYLYFSKTKTINYLISGALLTGLAILNYKGAQIFIILFPILILIKHKNRLKKCLIDLIFFSIVSLIPILFYWSYYSISSSSFHVYQIILKDVIPNFLVIFLFLIFIIFINFKKKLSHLFFIKDNLILYSNLFIFACLGYLLITNFSRVTFSFYSALILNSSFLIFVFQIINVSTIKNYKKLLIIFYIITDIFFLIFGFGGRGYFTSVPTKYHVIGALIFITQILYLGINYKKIQLTSQKQNLWVLIFIFNIWFAISIMGGELIPTRFQSLLSFLPLVLYIFIKVAKKELFIILLFFISVIFSLYLNIMLPNDYTLYSMDNFKDAQKYIKSEIKNNEMIFSADTSLLLSSNSNNAIAFHSPFHFRNDEDVYYYEEIKNRYGSKEISLVKRDILEKLKSNKPLYIYGSWRSTIRLFTNNDEWESFLKDNYRLIKQVNRVYFYKLDNNK